MSAPGLKHVCDLSVELGPIREMGAARNGLRRIIPIVGGTATGEISGRVQNLGADWQTLLADGSADIDTRYAVETDDGAIIEIVNKGVRHGPPEVLAALARGDEVDPARYYFRTAARLETGDPRYGWVNTTIFIGTGRRLASAVLISLYSVL
ncbi:DUF3237 domain-containing protein [Rhodobacterales bacterium]|nr:DUF3237 domain-containing protein [Rhodobacterales bacterium]